MYYYIMYSHYELYNHINVHLSLRTAVLGMEAAEASDRGLGEPAALQPLL